MRKVHPINLDQKFRLQAQIARRTGPDGKRLTMASLARALGEKYVNVASTIYDTRPGTPKTREMQVKIAAYLGLGVAELFNGVGKTVNEPPALPQPPLTLGQKIKLALGGGPAAVMESEG